MAIPFSYDDPLFMDEFEALLDDFRSDFDVTDEFGLSMELNVVSENSSNFEDDIVQKNKPKRKPKKSVSAKNVSKVTNTDIILSKSNSGAPHLKWNVFPSFDRSDSTVYFASSFARMCNNGDEQGLNKLVTTHCAKDVDVVLREGVGDDKVGRFVVPLTMYMDMLNTMHTILPDAMYCMHSTRVDGNKIFAVLYGKSTDCADMYNYRSTVVDPKYNYIFIGKRKDLLCRSLNLRSLDEFKRNAILRLIDLNVDLQMYSRVDITLTLHDRTKKIVGFTYAATTTSVCYEGVHYPTV